jgi:hypothetical protein
MQFRDVMGIVHECVAVLELVRNNHVVFRDRGKTHISNKCLQSSLLIVQSALV